MTIEGEIKEFDVYLGIEKDQEVAWGTLENLDNKVKMIKIYLDGKEVFKFTIATKRLNEMVCEELQKELTECYKELSYEKDGIPLIDTYR